MNDTDPALLLIAVLLVAILVLTSSPVSPRKRK